MVEQKSMCSQVVFKVGFGADKRELLKATS
jgi:hypothetical protein